MAKAEDLFSATSETLSEPVILELEPCPICTRTFVSVTLAEHVQICDKSATTRLEPKTSAKAVQKNPLSVKRGPGRPRLIKNGRPGRPKKQYNMIAISEQNTTIASPKLQEEVIKQALLLQNELIDTATTPSASHTPLSSHSAPEKESET